MPSTGRQDRITAKEDLSDFIKRMINEALQAGGGGPPSGPAGGSLTGAYPNPDLAANAVHTANIADGEVTGTKLADNAVTGAKITDATVTGTKLAASVAGAGLALSGGALVVSYGTTANTAVQGNDARFTSIASNAQTANYTLVLADAGKIIDITSASAVTVTIPSNASVAFPVGTVLQIIQGGAGAVTVAINTDTLRAPNGTQTARQYSVISLYKRSSTEWVLSGDTLAPTDLSAISGLSIWYKPLASTMYSDNMTTPIAGASGNSVLGWKDQSGGNRDGYQSSSGLAPLYQTNIQNGLPMLKFDGTAQRLPIAGLAPLLTGSDVPFSALVTFRQVNTLAQQTVYSVGSTSSTSPNCHFQCDTSLNWRVTRRDDVGTADPGSYGGLVDTSFHLAQIVFTGTTASLWVDGVQILNAVTMDVGALTLNTGGLGCLFRATPIQFFNGWIGSFALWNKALSAAEVAQALYYARSLWGI